MNAGYLITCAARIRIIAEKRLFVLTPYAVKQIVTDAKTIMRELRVYGWHLRDQGDKINGRRYLCRYVYESNPDYPVYMVLTWNGVCEVPHFDNEQDGVMRVTHWAEIDVLEGERA